MFQRKALEWYVPETSVIRLFFPRAVMLFCLSRIGHFFPVYLIYNALIYLKWHTGKLGLRILEKLSNRSPPAHDLQAFLVFCQHPAWVYFAGKSKVPALRPGKTYPVG